MQQRVFGERATVPELDAWVAQSTDPLLAELAANLAAGLDRPHAHALVALETGAVKSPDEVIPWDGTPQPFPEWEQDMTMREAVRVSNAAAFQVIARRIGLKRERQWLHRLGYGNREVEAAAEAQRKLGDVLTGPSERLVELAESRRAGL